MSFVPTISIGLLLSISLSAGLWLVPIVVANNLIVFHQPLPVTQIG